MARILIVEDDKKIAMALTIRLKAKSHEVLIAPDALIGFNLASQKKPDLVLLDIGMPGGGGFSVAERMQNLASTMGIPFIFLTASKDPALRARAAELGTAGYFEKPYEPEDLLAAIEKVLGQQSY